MSSPFATFRKNRQAWMAALVLLAILAFVVAPAIETATQSFRGGGEETTLFVQWDGGRMTRGEVEQAMAKRNQLLGFLRALSKRVVENGGEPAVPGFSRWQTGEIRSLGIDEDVSAQRICLGRIIATKANRMGIEFDDASVDEFLKSFCDGRISDEEFYELLGTSTGGLTMFDVRELLKQELAVMVAQNLAGGGSATRSPGKTWQDFLKLKQSAKVEAFPVFVSESLGNVSGNPSEEEIQEIYEEGKNLQPNPNSETAGFMQPDMANIEYIESKFQAWIDREKEKLTEEEIRAEYDRLVTLGQLKVPAADPPSSTESDGVEPATDEPSTEEPGQSEPGQSEPGQSEPGQSEPGQSEPAEGEPGQDEPTGEPAREPSEEPSGEPAAEPAGDPLGEPTEEPAGDPSGEPNAGLSSDQPSRADFGDTPSGDNPSRLVAFVQEEGTAGETVSPESTEPASQEPSDSTPDPTDSGDAAQVDSEVTDSVVTDSEVTDSQISESQPDSDQAAAPAMRTQTFEEARDEVAFQLARSKAVPLADEALTEIMKKMREYFLSYRQYQAYRNAGMDNAELPVRPDLKKMADQHQLTHSETGMVDSSRLATTNFGRSSVFAENQRMGFVADIATSPQIELFAPLQSGFAGPEPTEFYQYLFWKVDARPSVVPELNEVRDEVVDAWKRIQARKLAEEKAEQLRAKVGQGDDPWETALSDTLRTLVVTTDPFTWYSSMGMRVTPTVVPKLDGVGQEFMKRIFSADVGDVLVAPNQAKSVYYVTRVIEKSPDIDELRARFDEDQFKQGPAALADMELSSEANLWLSRLFSDLNVEFLE
jgi:hypothetical protein